MNYALIYFLKVNIAIALFYIFYRLVFYNDTFWGTRRLYLVFSILLSAVYPLISFSGWLEKQEPMQAIITSYVQLNEITVTTTPANHLTLENILLAVYGLVSLVLLGRMLVQLGSILQWRMKGNRQLLNDTPIIAIDGTITPFSFFKSIFMNPALHNEQEIKQILTHEKAHASQFHSLDVLLSEMLTISCWINPAAWLLKREIRHNLEFLADYSVLQSGIEPKNYQYHLLQLSFQVPENHLINKFNVSPLKKRITMMNQQKSRQASILKYSLIVPLALALVLSSNAQTLVSSAKKVVAAKDTIKSVKAVQRKPQKQLKPAVKFTPPVIKKESVQEEKVYENADKMPQFPGGENALLKYIATNLLYPVKAQAYGIQGKVIIQFIVNSAGKVTNGMIIKSIPAKANTLSEVVAVGYGVKKEPENAITQPVKQTNQPEMDMKLLENEALRIINILPDFTPGEMNGKKVAVYYTLPITFKLE